MKLIVNSNPALNCVECNFSPQCINCITLHILLSIGGFDRRMMKGILESKGLKVAESRVLQALERVDPIHYEGR